MTKIGANMFAGCSGLTDVTIPDSVKAIGSGAFSGCPSSLYDTNRIPGVLLVDGWVVESQAESLSGDLELTGIRGLAAGAFSGCTGVTSVTIPDVVQTIGSDLFYGCSALTNVTIPDSVTSIGEYAFWQCSGLTGVTIPDSVKNIGYDAFGGCSSALYDTNSIPGVRLVDGWAVGHQGFSGALGSSGIRGISAGAFNDCYGLTSVAIPDGTTRIGERAFSYCSALTNVTIPDSVTSIGDSAFSSCSTAIP